MRDYPCAVRAKCAPIKKCGNPDPTWRPASLLFVFGNEITLSFWPTALRRARIACSSLCRKPTTNKPLTHPKYTKITGVCCYTLCALLGIGCIGCSQCCLHQSAALLPLSSFRRANVPPCVCAASTKTPPTPPPLHQTNTGNKATATKQTKKRRVRARVSLA